MTDTLHRLDLIKANPPNAYVISEYCDGPGKSHDLDGDAVFVIGGKYLCTACVNVLESACDQCGMWRCACERER